MLCELPIGSPRLWDGASDPYLYRVTSELVDTAENRVTDRVTEPLGLRSVRVDADKGFFLNGRRVRLQGVNAHQDRLDKGWAIGSTEHDEDFALMDEMGVNALRTAHYQQDQYVYTLADRKGYVVWAEVPLVDKVTNSRAFTANAEQQLRELIRQNYNHPSLVFWSIGNEQASDDRASNALLARLAKVVAEEDPGRISTYASHLPDSAGVGRHTQTVAFNKYYGWYGGSLTGLGKWADTFRRTQPGRKVGISEYGAGASVEQHQENPQSVVPGSHWHPEEFQSRLHEAAWKQISERPFLWGSFVWNMFDFASDWRNEGDTPGRNDKGAGDLRPPDPQGRLLLLQGELEQEGAHHPHRQRPVDQPNNRRDDGQGLLRQRDHPAGRQREAARHYGSHGQWHLQPGSHACPGRQHHRGNRLERPAQRGELDPELIATVAAP